MSSFRILVVFVSLTASGFGREIYVDNVGGRDTSRGSSPDTANLLSGPVQTLRQATSLASYGDAIILKNNGVPYYDSMSLTGPRHSGSAIFPFIVEGNGATLSGLRSIHPDGWQQTAPNLWRLIVRRKSYLQLLRDGKPLPEFIMEDKSDPRSTLPAGNWTQWKGAVYFHQDGPEAPAEQSFSYTADQTGISLHKVSYVTIRNLNVEYFRFDGVHAQGICDHVELVDVQATGNARAGFVASGGSAIRLIRSRSERNRLEPILAIGRSSISNATE